MAIKGSIEIVSKVDGGAGTGTDEMIVKEH
jgi:hypothetical protein